MAQLDSQWMQNVRTLGMSNQGDFAQGAYRRAVGCCSSDRAFSALSLARMRGIGRGQSICLYIIPESQPRPSFESRLQLA